MALAGGGPSRCRSGRRGYRPTQHWYRQLAMERIEIKVLDKNVVRAGNQAASTGNMMQELEPRTLQHHLLVMIFWLIVGIGLLFWFVV